MEGIHLDDLHDAVVAELGEVPWLESVTAYPEKAEDLVCPCAFFSVADWDFPDAQPMNGQVAVELNCELLVAFGRAEDAYQRDVRNAAMALCAKIYQNRWGLQVGDAVLKSAGPDGFSPELDEYSVWRIEWVQPVDVGKDKFADDGVVPSEVRVSFAPDVGAGQEDKYAAVVEPDSGGASEAVS